MTPLANYITKNRFALIDGFVSAAMCAELLESLATVELTPALAVPHGQYEGQIDLTHRVSDMATRFPLDVQQQLLLLEMRIEDILGTDGSQWEGWQYVEYPPGGKFNEHHDTGLIRHRKNERMYTVVLTLQQPEEGGRTAFPHLGVEIPSVTGRLLMWNNLTPDGRKATDMLHSGRPVVRGCKRVLINWIHQNRYR